MILNPTTLSRVYDNEFLVEEDKDAITLPEILGKLDNAIWSEIKAPAKGEYSARKPLISSLRRNLQREYLERLVSLSMPGNLRGSSSRPLATSIGHAASAAHCHLSEGAGPLAGRASRCPSQCPHRRASHPRVRVRVRASHPRVRARGMSD